MSQTGERQRTTSEYDAVIVGASLAGCSAAVKLGRAGARVALVERRPDPQAYKTVCSHFVQASGVPALERMGLLEPILAAGGVRSRLRIWTRWGWISAPAEHAQSGLNLRREVLDPLLRDLALATPGVEPLLGFSATELVREGGAGGACAVGDARAAGSADAAGGVGVTNGAGAGGRVRGVVVRERSGAERELRARLVIGADGRGSTLAQLAGAQARVTPHGRIAYGAYFEDCAPASAPDASIWMLDPQWAAAFPTDRGLTFYAAMPTKAWQPAFREDPSAALVAFLADLPDPPPIDAARQLGKPVGKLDMTTVEHDPAGPGFALIGDAALAADPLWGIGCGWAFQSAEWLGDAVGALLARGAAADDAALDAALAGYRRTWTKALRPHARMLESLNGGRAMNAGERFLFSAAARDGRVAEQVEAVGSRSVSPGASLVRGLPLALAVNVRHTLARRPRYAPYRTGGRRPGGDAGSSPPVGAAGAGGRSDRAAGARGAADGASGTRGERTATAART